MHKSIFSVDRSNYSKHEYSLINDQSASMSPAQTVNWSKTIFHMASRKQALTSQINNSGQGDKANMGIDVRMLLLATSGFK